MIFYDVFCTSVDSKTLWRPQELEVVRGACRACPRFNRRWGCPPFEDASAAVYAYPKVILVGIEVDAGVNLRELRLCVESELLRFERAWNGRYVALPGDCPYCASEADCARLMGVPCRHSDAVRPSLEALGVDVQRLVGDAFGRRIEWGTDVLFLVAGLFYGGSGCDGRLREAQLSEAVSAAVGRLARVSRRRES